MEKIHTLIEQRPHYYRTQLLLEDDFLAEQNFHINTSRRHNRHLHGWGVVRGLTVGRASDASLAIYPGIAIDESGCEIFLEETKYINLVTFGPHDLLRVTLSHEEAAGAAGGTSAPQNRRDVYAVLTVSERSEASPGVTLATVQLDGQGKIGEAAIDYSHTRYAKIVSPGSITSTELHESLRKGWLRLPFRPAPMVEGPEEGIEEGLPAFRVGATEALSPTSEKANERDKGAAGTMAIPIPPSVTQVTRLRLAGARNEGEILLRLIIGGWDPHKNEHFRKTLLDEKITSEPFIETFKIGDTVLDPEYQTLALWLRGTRRTSVSLVAVEFVY